MLLRPDWHREVMASLAWRSRILWLALLFAVLLHAVIVALMPSASDSPAKVRALKKPIRFNLHPSRAYEKHKVEPEPSEASRGTASVGRSVSEPFIERERVGGSGESQEADQGAASEAPSLVQSSKEASSSNPVDLSPDFLARQISEVSHDIVQAKQNEMHRRRIVHLQDVKEGKVQVSAYEVAWQEKVEHVGNLNFPEQARRDKLSGSLQMAVGIRSDGTVYSIQILRSSGQPALDEGARKIIQLAAPFAPLPLEARGSVDVLVITRTWRFDSEYRFAGSNR